MFGAKKKSDAEVTATQAQQQAPLPKGYTPKKGTATRTRKEAEAGNRRPLVSDKTKMSREERRELKREQRAREDQAWRKQQEAMRTGDDAHMPAQHRGKVRRFGRDYIDASTLISTWFMPMAILLLPAMFFTTKYPRFMLVFTSVFYGIFFLMLVQAVFVTLRARRLAAFKFGEIEIPRGYRWQLLARAFYLRRWRMPKPQVARGEFPVGGTKADLAAMREENRKRNSQGV